MCALLFHRRHLLGLCLLLRVHRLELAPEVLSVPQELHGLFGLLPGPSAGIGLVVGGGGEDGLGIPGTVADLRGQELEVLEVMG